MDAPNYQKLIVWQKSMALIKLTYSLTKKLPKEEIYSLTNQMRRAVISIASNIAEGQERKSNKEFIQFLKIAQGSRSELETQFLACKEIGYLADTDITETMSLLQEINRMLNVLIKKLETAPVED